MADEFGGIAVDEPSTDEFGGVPLEEPALPPIKLSPYQKATLSAGAEPVSGPFGPANPQEVASLAEAITSPVKPLPTATGRGPITGPLSAMWNVIGKPVLESAETPAMLLAAPSLAASAPLRIGAGLAFGGMAAKGGLEKMASKDPQTQLEGRMELASAPLLALAGGQPEKVVRNVPRGTITPDAIVPAIRKIGGEIVPGEKGQTHPEIIKEEKIPATEIDQRGFTDPQGNVFLDREAAAQGTQAPTEFEQGRLHSTDLSKAQETTYDADVHDKAVENINKLLEGKPRPSRGELFRLYDEEYKRLKSQEAPPTAPTEGAPPTAPATVTAKEVSPVVAGSPEPAITEPKPVEPVGQAISVTPPVTDGIKRQGPGAASVGDVPKQSPLNQLSQQIQAQGLTSPNLPISERISNALGIADKWAKKKDSLTQGLAKTRAASQALIDSYVSQPKWTDFISSIGKWVGADQKTALEVRDFQKRIVKAIPNRLRQEAITNWIQANGDEALLRDRAQSSKPSVRKGYELALTLTEGEKNIARNIQSYLESRLDEGLKAGLLKQGVENYVTQVWKRPTTATQKMWADLFGVGSLNPNFRYAKQRIFDSYFEGEQAGYTPKNKTIGNLVSVYDLAFNRALSARGLIKELQTGKASDGMPITMTSGKTSAIAGDNNIPEAFLIKPNTPPTGAVTADGRPYRPIDHWALRDWKWATKGPEGQPVFVQGDMLVHPDHWDHLNNVLKHSRLQSNPVTGTILRASALAKQTKLSLSPFHTVQEAVHSAAHRVNPFNPTEINLNDPVQKGLVDHGLMIQDPRSQELFAEGVSGGGLVGKIPGLGQLQQWYTEMTFKDYIPKLKMNMALDALERNRKAYAGKLNDDQIQALTARESNAAFGEQNYRMMGRSPNVQDFLRLVLLAPDFLEARARFIGQALKPYGREQRIALGLMAASLYTAARVINKASDDDYHWDKPFSVFANGKEYRLRTLLGDAQHLVTDPRSFWYNRLSAISRTVSEYITGRDDRGIKRSSMEQLADFASWFKPIPLQIRSDQTLKDAALASIGIPSKRYSKQQEVYEIADRWMKNNPDPKVKERYDRIRQETLPDSPYRPLRDALNKDDLKAARREYDKLRQTRSQSLIHQSMRHSRPFTGSLSSDIKFKNSLTPEQLKTYNLAIKERQDQYQKFLKAINQ